MYKIKPPMGINAATTHHGYGDAQKVDIGEVGEQCGEHAGQAGLPVAGCRKRQSHQGHDGNGQHVCDTPVQFAD